MLFRRPPGEEVAAKLRPLGQQLPRVLHGLQALHLERQGSGHLLTRGLVLAAQVGQQQTRFQVGQPRRHHQIVGGDLQVGLLGGGDELQVLVGQGQDRYLGNVELMVTGQGQQNVERPFIAVEIDHEDNLAVHRRRLRGIEIVAHAIPCVFGLTHPAPPSGPGRPGFRRVRGPRTGNSSGPTREPPPATRTRSGPCRSDRRSGAAGTRPPG